MKNPKIVILAFALAIGHVISYAQSKTAVGVRFGVADNTLHRFQNITGGASGEGKLSLLAGVWVDYGLNDRLTLISGLDYARHSLTVVGAPMPSQVKTDGRVTTLSIPLGVEWSIGQWFFIHGGPTIDLQPEKWDAVDSQGGIGFSAGIGGRYALRNWSFSLIPSVKQYALIPFSKEKYHQRLMTAGSLLAVGYLF